MARRYLVGHGPASAADLAKWAGVRLVDARAGFDQIRDETKPEANGMVDLVGRPRAPDVPPPGLLGPFDPVLHGWASRDFVLAGHHSIVTTNGLFRPFALVRGRAVATWGLANGRVTVRPLEPIAGEDLARAACGRGPRAGLPGAPARPGGRDDLALLPGGRSGRHAVAQVHDAVPEPALIEELEVRQARAGRQRRLAPTDDHGPDKQPGTRQPAGP